MDTVEWGFIHNGRLSFVWGVSGGDKIKGPCRRDVHIDEYSISTKVEAPGLEWIGRNESSSDD